VARGRVRESVAAFPIVEGTVDIIPDKAFWAALVALGMLCSIYRYEDKHNGTEGVNVATRGAPVMVEMSDELGDEVKGIPKSIGLPYYQISKRNGKVDSTSNLLRPLFVQRQDQGSFLDASVRRSV
jgi:hypothetical protein